MQMTATSKLFVREGSMAPVYSMLLFGGELSVHLDKALITVSLLNRLFRAHAKQASSTAIRCKWSAVHRMVIQRCQ